MPHRFLCLAQLCHQLLSGHFPHILMVGKLLMCHCVKTCGVMRAGVEGARNFGQSAKHGRYYAWRANQL